MASIDTYSKLRIIKSKEDLQEYYDTNNRKESGVVIKLFDDFTKEFKNFELLNVIANDIVGFQRCGLAYVNLLVPYERMEKEDFAHIKDFWNAIKGKINCNVCVNHKLLEEGGFYDYEKQLKWHVETIIRANSEIDRVCKTIKDSKLSPFEALAYINEYVGNVALYNSSKDKKDPTFAKDQYFAGAFESLPEIICMGYASLMKEIIDNLNMSGLSCEIFGTHYSDKDTAKDVDHARCFIRIKDNKYKLNQTCFCDPTWDGKGERATAKSVYTFFAMSSECNKPDYNGRFIYIENNDVFFLIDRKTFYREKVDYNERGEGYNKSVRKIDQHMIEKCYFNMKQKTENGKDFETLMSEIENMTIMSYMESHRLKFIGHIKDKKTQLSREEAQKIYNENEKNIKRTEKKSTNDEEVCL